MSEFKTNKISPRSGTTQTIGDSGDSVSTSSGSTINNAGTITTAGITGGTINNTTGSIYLRGEVDWQPSDIKTASFTATDNQGFFVNTTSGQITVTLPASPSAGDVVGIKDYANTFDTNKCILNANGNKIQGSTQLFEITVEGSSIIIIYVDATQGWVITDASKASDIAEDIRFVTATGGTITTCGNFKIHTFTGPGTFCVSSISSTPAENTVGYMVLAGGASGARFAGVGGGGAGGFREGRNVPIDNFTASPLVANAPTNAITLTVQGYPITVGAGGASQGCCSSDGNPGSNSIFSTITSAGGGGGGRSQGDPLGSSSPGLPGGSGGGNAFSSNAPAGLGNTPPVSPPQGNPGGRSNEAPGSPANAGGGGGGAGAAGATGTSSCGGNGGAGITTSINGTPTTRAGGGGGSANSGTSGTGGSGGGTAGTPYTSGAAACAAAANTGAGGGAAGNNVSGAGGSGIVIIRYKFQ